MLQEKTSTRIKRSLQKSCHLQTDDILHKCSRNNVPAEKRKLLGSFISESHWSNPHTSPPSPTSSYTSTDTIQIQRKYKQPVDHRFLSCHCITERCQIWAQPPSQPHGPCRSVVTVCSFEVIFKMCLSSSMVGTWCFSSREGNRNNGQRKKNYVILSPVYIQEQIE